MNENHTYALYARNYMITAIMALLIACLSASMSFADIPRFTSIDYPGAGVTIANAVNSKGEIVGIYRMPGSAVPHGFLLQRGVFAEIAYPGALRTRAYGINDAGDIVGDYSTFLTGTKFFGFLLRDGAFTPIEYPLSSTTAPWGIDNAGSVTGSFTDTVPTPKVKAFVWRDGVFTVFEAPFSGHDPDPDAWNK